MEGKKVIFYFVICFLTVFFLAKESVALGVSVNRIIDFEPNLEEDYKFCVRNSKDVSQEIEFNIKEEGLGIYMHMNEEGRITLSPNEIKCTSYHVKLPESFEKPGIHGAEVEVKEIPKRSFAGGFGFNVVVAVKHIFQVRVPYPGKYVELDLATWDLKENETAYFTVQAISRGTETIEKISGIADVYKGEDVKVGSVEFTEIKNLETAQTQEMYAEWDSKGNMPGIYKIIAKLDYDGKKEELEKTFKIGTLKLDIIDYTKELYNGTINQFEIDVESKWNDNIQNAYAEVEIKKGSYKSNFKTPQENIVGWEKKKLSGYWDGTDAEIGQYDITITLHYAGKTTTEKGIVNVVEKAGDEIEKPAPVILNTTILLIAIIIIIVLFDIVWFLKKKKK